MWWTWFQDNAWIATWVIACALGVMDGTIFYLIVTFLGGLDRKERKIVAWKLKTMGQMTEADRIRMEEDG